MSLEKGHRQRQVKHSREARMAEFMKQGLRVQQDELLARVAKIVEPYGFEVWKGDSCSVRIPVLHGYVEPTEAARKKHSKYSMRHLRVVKCDGGVYSVFNFLEPHSAGEFRSHVVREHELPTLLVELLEPHIDSNVAARSRSDAADGFIKIAGTVLLVIVLGFFW